MKQKKTVVITFRVEEEIREKINKISERKQWSISQVVEYICKDYFNEKEKHGITPAEAVQNYKQRLEEEIEEIPLDNFEEKEDLINEIFRLIDIA